MRLAALLGAGALAALGLGSGAPAPAANGPPLGGPAHCADRDGDGRTEIAEVVTPHIGGTLRIWRVGSDGLTEVAAAPGFSNHRIGEPVVTSGLRACGKPELVLPDVGWTSLRAVGLEAGGVVERPLPFPATRDGLARALACGAP